MMNVTLSPPFTSKIVVKAENALMNREHIHVNVILVMKELHLAAHVRVKLQIIFLVFVTD